MKSESGASQRRGDDFRPSCHAHGETPVAMEGAIFPIHFPRGSLPARGYRCPKCGDEVVTASEMKKLESMAHGAGLYGIENAQTRKLIQTGNSLAVTLDRELLKAVGIVGKAGRSVRVGRVGDHLVILPE